MTPEHVRRWVEDQRAAHKAGQSADDNRPVEASVSWRQALSLLALVGQSVGWPVVPDEVRKRGEAHAAAAWERLRTVYGNRR